MQERSSPRIIGIDPGTCIAGYGVVDLSKTKLIPIVAGAWKLKKNKTIELAERLGALSQNFRAILEQYKPSHLCIEQSFVADNPKTALFLGHARGVILAEAYLQGLHIAEISATSAKKMVTGYGRAPKEAMAQMMGLAFGCNLSHLPFDATDALAIAFAHGMQLKNPLLV